MATTQFNTDHFRFAHGEQPSDQCGEGFWSFTEESTGETFVAFGRFTEARRAAAARFPGSTVRVDS